MSKKQKQLLNLITSQNTNEIEVLGSVQSGKTYDICLGSILYAQALYEYDKETQYNGAIIGWTTDTLKGNVVDVMKQFLDDLHIPYELKYSQIDKYVKIYNIKYYFFSFNNYLSFNKILGRPLIYIWVDEAARIYTQQQLRQSFDELPGRQLSFVGHPYLKTIHSYNVEGNENHPYKIKYIDERPSANKLIFYPYDNPKITTEEQMRQVINLFPKGSLRDQKIYCKWVIAEGLVFNKVNIIESLDGLVIREIGLGIDYGSENPTTFVPIALAWNNKIQKWVLVRLETYYHDGRKLGTNPTTEYFSKQLRLFIAYLKEKYKVPITDCVIDSEATHFDNRLITDGIRHETSIKGPGSVVEGVQYMQALFYKEYMFNYKHNSIRHINDDGTMIYENKDMALLEDQSYQYDTNRSIKEGYDCYKKENDHSIDGRRYLLQIWRMQNKAPTV